MFLSAYLAIVLAAADSTELRLEPGKSSISVSWADTEDRIQGTITPALPAADEPITVSVNVGSFEGADFDGPVTMSLRPVQQMGSVDSATLTRGKGEKTWLKRFTVPEAGNYLLEISFRTTHLKVARGVLPVGDARLPPWFPYAVGGTLLGFSLGFGLYLVLRKTPDRGAVLPDPPPRDPPAPPTP